MVWKNEKLIGMLKMGGVVVMPTDTIYGIVGRAEDRNVVKKIYEIRKRTPEKPCIILVGDLSELKKFNIVLTEMQKNKIGKYRRPTSFILDCPDEKFSYLHRSTKTLAFRLPASQELRKLLIKTGPLIAPSANPEGLSPARNIREAKTHFGNSVDLYINGGTIVGKPSKIIRLHKDGSIAVLRE